MDEETEYAHTVYSASLPLWNHSKRLQEKEVLNTLDTHEVHTFPMHTIKKNPFITSVDGERLRNPGLIDAMILRHLLISSEDSGMCIHCGVFKQEEGASLEYKDGLSVEVCESCAKDIFENEELPQPYKYCPTCHDFHSISFFVDEESGSLSRSCVHSIVECVSQIEVFTDPHSITEWKYSEEDRSSDSLTSLLRKEGCLRPSLSHCSHCGCSCSSDTHLVNQLCARCRSEYVFRWGPSLWYKWCGVCECFHRLAAFYDVEKNRFDVTCLQPHVKTVELPFTEVAEASLPRDEAAVVEKVQKHYPARREEATEEVREALGVVERGKGQCLLCGRGVENGGWEWMCGECAKKWVVVKGHSSPVRYCGRCGLFHPYFLFFDPEQGVYGEQCNKRVVEKAMELGVVRHLPVVCEPSVPTKEELQEVVKPIQLNRCRSPEAFSHLGKSEVGCCAHCGRDMREEYAEENPAHVLLWVCPFCRSHWFCMKEGKHGKHSKCNKHSKHSKQYKWCKACGSFHSAVYFYDPSSKSFHEQCLHSELNEMKQRKRDRAHDEWMTVSEEAAMELPSMVSEESESDGQSVLRVMCSKLHHPNPHERVVLGMFLSCVMEESWKE